MSRPGERDALTPNAGQHAGSPFRASGRCSCAPRLSMVAWGWRAGRLPSADRT